ncbi:hypothetical protein EDB82DRAFT_180546 [Fusarium venenatum]|uniref:uncharacterized protein n=1 Tax=Fusarium venenatum TaxID=56646 RepID=UPI001D8A31E3|nr:hypothetical protein EDB82DRAFT_180546 [Fusarium venenatum]
MERRFNGRHGLFIDLARIVSVFFSFILFQTQKLSFLILIFIILQLPLTMGSCLFTMYVFKERGGISVGTAGMYRMEWYQKRNIVLLNDDGLRLHCDKTKRTTIPQKHFCERRMAFCSRHTARLQGLAKGPGGAWFSYRRARENYARTG